MTGEVTAGDRVVLFNTGSGVKYMESFRQLIHRLRRLLEENEVKYFGALVLLLAVASRFLPSSLHPHG